jgi:hypothetical protein
MHNFTQCYGKLLIVTIISSLFGHYYPTMALLLVLFIFSGVYTIIVRPFKEIMINILSALSDFLVAGYYIFLLAIVDKA